MSKHDDQATRPHKPKIPPPEPVVPLNERLRTTGMVVTAVVLSWLTSTVIIPWLKPSAAIAPLKFGPILFAGHNNYVYRDSVTSVQVVISDKSPDEVRPVRFITAFPKGNTGALVYFVPVSKTRPLGAELNVESLSSVRGDYSQTGVVGEVSLDGDAEFGVTLIGSVRTIRDYVETGGKVFNPLFNYTLGAYDEKHVELVRNWINGTTVQYLNFATVENCVFQVTPDIDPPRIVIARSDKSRKATVAFTSSFNFTQTTPKTDSPALERIDPDGLILPLNRSRNPETTTILDAVHTKAESIVEQLAFLSYRSESLAGGWRFLTYFGRDTLLTLRLMRSILSPQASEAILAAVVERIDPKTGQVAHEETVGDYASFLNMKKGRYSDGNRAVYDYAMVDTDFLLLPALADYTEQFPGRAALFMKRQSTLAKASYMDLIQANTDNVLRASAPFTVAPVADNLIGLRAFPLGNWRDSPAGLGWGQYPFDVNCALVPAALRAIAKLSTTGFIEGQHYGDATVSAEVWERNAWTYFEVEISSSEARAALEAYVPRAGLSASTLYGAGSLNSSSDGTLAFNNPEQAIGYRSSKYYALALDRDRKPIKVLHSDLAFTLLYSTHVEPSVLRAVVEAMQPYPRGLLTNVGMLVANPAYDPNPSSAPMFSNRAYHGAVSWSWQQALMAEGLRRQLEICTLAPEVRPQWCGWPKLVNALRQAQARLWTSIEGSKDVLYTEVWSPVFDKERARFTVGDLGALSGDGTEGDAMQLWSYGFLALVDPRTGRPVAAGF